MLDELPAHFKGFMLSDREWDSVEAMVVAGTLGIELGDGALGADLLWRASGVGDPVAAIVLAVALGMLDDCHDLLADLAEQCLASGLSCPIAYFALGRCYQGGFGRKVDISKAIELHREAVELGFERSQNELGYLLYYYRSKGEGIVWLNRAAARGEAAPHVSLADAYSVGVGVPLDTARAQYHLEQAAYLGHPHAQEFLERMRRGEVGWAHDGRSNDQWKTVKSKGAKRLIRSVLSKVAKFTRPRE